MTDAQRWELEQLRDILQSEEEGRRNFPLIQAIDAALAEPPQYPHWQCRTHGTFDAYVAVGCPECVREMRERVTELEGAQFRATARALRIEELERQLESPARTGCDDCLDARRVLQARVDELEQAIHEFSHELRQMSVRLSNSTMTPEKLKALLEREP